jgi:hypothetical protein
MSFARWSDLKNNTPLKKIRFINLFMPLYSMKKVLFVFAFLLLFSSTFALSCAPTQPRIGIVTAIEEPVEEYDFYTITIDSIQTFDSSLITLKNNRVAIGQYNKIIADYQNGGELTTPLTESEYPFAGLEQLSLSPQSFELLGAQKGDTIILGPPFNVCSYQFIGLAKDGNLVRAAVNAYGDFVLDGDKFSVAPGNKTAPCEAVQGNACPSTVFVTIGENKIELEAGEKTWVSPSTSLSLIDASIEEHFLWGIGHRAEFVLDFTGLADDHALLPPPKIKQDTTPIEQSFNSLNEIVNSILSFFGSLFG